MATEEYKGPDISFVEAQEKATKAVRLKYYQNTEALKAAIARKFKAQLEKQEAKADETAAKRQQAYLEKDVNIRKKLLAEIRKEEKDNAAKKEALIKEQAALEQKIVEQALQKEMQSWTVAKRKQYQEDLKLSLEASKAKIDGEITQLEFLRDEIGLLTEEQQEALDRLQQQSAEMENAAKAASAEAERYSTALFNASTYTEKLKTSTEKIKELKEKQADLEKQKKAAIELGIDTGELDKELAKVATELNKNTEIQKKSRSGAAKEKVTEELHKRLQDMESNKEDSRAELKARFGTEEGRKNEALKAVGESMKKMQESLDNGLKEIDSKINSFYEMQAKMEARLQGATLGGNQISYERLLKNMSQTVGFSGLVKQTDIAKNIQGFIEAGVAYNIEGRAFLATIADSVASTFDAKNPDLLRLIRLQQQDTTAARLGLEASLTRLFNEYFSDTSYLAQAFDSVSSSLVDVSSMLSRNDSIEFEYIVQKWLGSLTALGLSENAATTIAQGLNYLGTGNVSALNSNSALQTLFAMSSGGSYADILTHGLTAESTNDLLRNMVVYLKSIADGTNTNLVVKSAYSELLGVGVSDLAAISNLTETEIENLYNKSETYDKLITETQSQLNQVSSRIHISQLLTNIMDNALTTTATGIGGTPGLYGIWKAANIVEGLTGGIDIPSVMALGTGVDLNTTVTRLLKTGIAGASLIGQLVGSLASGRSGGALNLDSWKIRDATVRGVQRKALTMGSLVGVSQSSGLSFVGSGSGGDIQDSTLAGGAENAEKTSQITNSSANKEETVIDKIYKSIGEQQEGTNILQQLIGVNENVSRITQLISAGADLEQIQSQAASNIAQGSALSGNLSNSNKTGLGVIVNGLSEETKKYIEHIVRVTLAGMIVGDSNIGENGENTSLPEKLVQLLSTSTIPVNITNDWFDDAIQRSAFN